MMSSSRNNRIKTEFVAVSLIFLLSSSSISGTNQTHQEFIFIMLLFLFFPFVFNLLRWVGFRCRSSGIEEVLIAIININSSVQCRRERTENGAGLKTAAVHKQMHELQSLRSYFSDSSSPKQKQRFQRICSPGRWQLLSPLLEMQMREQAFPALTLSAFSQLKLSCMYITTTFTFQELIFKYSLDVD